jgi:hypothetical protein
VVWVEWVEWVSVVGIYAISPWKSNTFYTSKTIDVCYNKAGSAP